MFIYKYLIINNRGNVFLKEREPKLAGNEVAIRLKLEIPDAFFKRPFFEAQMKIPQEAVPKTKITTDVIDNVERIVKEVTGLNLVVSLVEQKESEKK